MVRELLHIMKPDGTAFNNVVLSAYSFATQTMGETTLSASFYFNRIIDDSEWTGEEYVDFRLNRYFVRRKPSWSKENGSVMYKYDLIFTPEKEILKRIYFTDAVVLDGNSRYHSENTDVRFMGDIREFAKRLQASLTYNMPTSGWTVYLPDGLSSEIKEITFNQAFFFDVLNTMYETYGIPYTIQAKTIFIGNPTYVIPYEFEYGSHKGLYSIQRTNKNNDIITRITGRGSNENIPFRYPAIEGLKDQEYLMPSCYRKDGSLFYDATEEEEYPNPINPKYPIMRFIDFPDIKPSIKDMKYNEQAIDVVKSISYFDGNNDDIDEESGEVKFPNFKIELHPLGFDLYKHASARGEMTLSLTTGSCAGCYFNVQIDEDQLAKEMVEGANRPNYPDSTNQSITLIVKKDIDTFGTLLPNVNIKPKSGDKFVILYIDLPQEYIESAEAKLDEALKKHMRENNVEQFSYDCSFDEMFLVQHPEIESELGDNSIVKVKYKDKVEELYVSGYTINVEDNSVLPKFDVQLIDRLSVEYGTVGNIENEIKDTTIIIDNHDNQIKKGASDSRRIFKSLEKLHNGLFNADGSNKIDDIYLHVLGLAVGQNVSNFELPGCKFIPNYDNDPNAIQVTPCQMVHYALNWDDGTAGDDPEDKFYEWTIPAFTRTALDPDADYYIYVKASRTNNSAVFELNSEQKKYDSVEGFYYLVVGQLFKPENNYRTIQNSYGMTYITGGQFVGSKLQSHNFNPDNQTGMMIDLANALIEAYNVKIKGTVTIGNGSSGLANLEEWSEKENAINSLEYLKSLFSSNPATSIGQGYVLSSMFGAVDSDNKLRSFVNGDPDKMGGSAFVAGIQDDERKIVDIRHDGSADIGILQVNRNADGTSDSVNVLDNSGNIKITIGNKTLENYVSVEGTRILESLSNSSIRENVYASGGNYAPNSRSGNFNTVIGELTNVSSGIYNAFVNIKANVEARPAPETGSYHYPYGSSASVVNTVQIKAFNKNGDVIYSQTLGRIDASLTLPVIGDLEKLLYNDYDEFVFSQNLYMNLKEDCKIQIIMYGDWSIFACGTTDLSFIDARVAKNNISLDVIKMVASDRKTVLASDGVAVRINSENYFHIRNNGSGIEIRGTFPEYSETLQSGTLYKDSNGFLKVK